MKALVAALLLIMAAMVNISTVQAQEVEWTPLDPARFGPELFEPWITVPDGSSGAPRQGWLNTADGFFTREAHLAYDWSRVDGEDAHQGLARFHYPLSRRLWSGRRRVPHFVHPHGDASAGPSQRPHEAVPRVRRRLSSARLHHVRGAVLGHELDPARSVASAIPARSWKAIWIYFAAPIPAMLLAAELFQ